MEPGEPALFNASTYQRQQLQDAHIREATVLSMVAYGNWLAAGLSSGHVILWDDLSSAQTASRKSKLRVNIQSTIYDLKTHENLLFCGSDLGLIVYRWDHLINAANTGSEIKPLFELPLVNAHSKVQLIAPPECNSIAIDPSSDKVWLAGGDGVAYGVDLTAMKISDRTPSVGVGNKLYSVCTAPGSSSLYAGGESGVVSLFDSRKMKQHASMEVCKGVGWISCLTVGDDGQWLTCAGGKDKQGHVSLWHAPTTTRLCQAQADAPVHAITYHDEALVSVGGESYITYWDVHPSSGDSGLTAKGRAMSSASALYAALPVSMAQESALECQVDSRGALVVAGEAPRVDFFMTPSSRTLSFSV